MIKISKEIIEIENMIIINKNLDDQNCLEVLRPISKSIYIMNNDFITLNNKKNHR